MFYPFTEIQSGNISAVYGGVSTKNVQSTNKIGKATYMYGKKLQIFDEIIISAVSTCVIPYRIANLFAIVLSIEGINAV